MDLNILRLTYFFRFKKEDIGSIQINVKIIFTILLTKICINFHTQVFNAFRTT